MATESDLLPFRPDVGPHEPEPAVVSIEAVDDVIEVLSSATARAVLSALYEKPGPASEIADRVNTSIQNVTYHLTSLASVELVTVVGTWYSSKGKEMKVYAPAKDPLILVAGMTSDGRSIAAGVTDVERSQEVDR